MNQNTLNVLVSIKEAHNKGQAIVINGFPFTAQQVAMALSDYATICISLHELNKSKESHHGS